MNHNLLKTMILTVLSATSAQAAGSAVVGTVRFAGTAPAAATLPVTKDGSVCGSAKTDESLQVDKAGGLKNVVVSLVGVAGAKRPAPQNGVLGQKTCVFSPHVQALPAGSTLVMGNDDNVLHNVHGKKANGDTEFNLALPMPDMKATKKLKTVGLTTVRCDAGHAWMSAYVWTFDHPYYAVTDATGAFSIQDVPPGSYTLRVWHEGWTRPKGSESLVDRVAVTRDVPVVVEAGKGATVSVELK